MSNALNPILENLTEDGSKCTIVQNKLNERVQELLPNIEQLLDEASEKLGITNPDELFDNLGAYLGVKAIDLMFECTKELLDNATDPLTIKVSFDGPSYIRCLYDAQMQNEIYARHKQTILEKLSEIKDLPNHIVITYKLNVVASDGLIFQAIFENQEVYKAQHNYYKSLRPIMLEQAASGFSSTPTAFEMKAANSIVDTVLERITTNKTALISTPARFYQSVIKNAKAIEVNGVEINDKYKVGDKLIENLNANELQIDDVLSGMSFK